MIPAFEIVIPCVCNDVIRRLKKRINRILKKNTYFVITVTCESHRLHFQLRSFPEDDQLLDDEAPRGKSWSACPESDKILALNILSKISA